LIFCSQFVFAQFIFAQNDSDKIKNSASNSHREIVYEFYKLQDSKNTTRPDWATGNYFKFTISPQKFSYPILKHRLNVPLSFIEYENAYPFYVEAMKEFDKVKNERLRICWQSEEYQKTDRNDYDKIQQLEYNYFPIYMPYSIEKFTKRVSAAKEAEIYDKLSHVYKLLEKGSRSRYYKWGDSNDLNGIYTDLSCVQDARFLGRYLSSKADWEIRNGRYDDATKTIRVGLALGDHIMNSAPSNFLVSLLVGNAINGMIQRQILHLIAQPNAPNLYPELTQLRPHFPLLTDAISSEQTGFVFTKSIKSEIWDNYENLSSAECKQIIEQITGVCSVLNIDDFYLNAENFRIRKNDETRLLFLFCAFSYQPAKERLRERGMSDEKINSLSIYQVIAPYAIEKISHAYGLVNVSVTLKSHNLRDSKTFIGDNWILQELTICSSVDYLLRLLLPASQGAMKSIERTDQFYDLVKIIEAIRYYAAVHDGKLPESLDAIKETPVPKICLLSGKPYVYKVEGKTITIDYVSGFDSIKLDSRLELVVE
ncbi:MAG: hypothetical protein LBP59_08025, partial [Planctomycetaceae bacterium]|nr:hypothetical protein [Planctomycetaceae bacterium]